MSLSYCPQYKHVLARLKQLYQQRSQNVILAIMNTPRKCLVEFKEKYGSGDCGYPDIYERIEFWNAYNSEHMLVCDDSIPSAYLSEMDQGLYGGVLGGNVQFSCTNDIGFISSMVHPILKDWSEFDNLVFTTEHEWYRLYTSQLEKFYVAFKDKLGISNFTLINGLNFVFELVGATQAYTALIDRPDMVQRAFELSYKINLQIHKTFFEKIPLLGGGTCDFFAQWLPGRIIAESVDPFHMTSIDYFEKWGREPIEKIFSQFDGGTTHIHGNGRHLLKAVASLKGLKMILLGDDKGYPRAFEVLNQLKKEAGDMPLACYVKFPDFYHALQSHTLLGGVLYNVGDVPDVITANKCMELVHSYII